MKRLYSAKLLMCACLLLGLCYVLLVNAQSSGRSIHPITPAPSTTAVIKITFNESANTCGGGLLIIDHPFLNGNMDVAFGGVNMLYEDETSAGQFPIPNGFLYNSSPIGDCPGNKWLMSSAGAGATYIFTATKVH